MSEYQNRNGETLPTNLPICRVLYILAGIRYEIVTSIGLKKKHDEKSL